MMFTNLSIAFTLPRDSDKSSFMLKPGTHQRWLGDVIARGIPVSELKRFGDEWLPRDTDGVDFDDVRSRFKVNNQREFVNAALKLLEG